MWQLGHKRPWRWESPRQQSGHESWWKWEPLRRWLGPTRLPRQEMVEVANGEHPPVPELLRKVGSLFQAIGMEEKWPSWQTRYL